MTQVRRASLADQAAELLLERVRSGEWPLGTRLPGEHALAPQLGVGRSTVREAIRMLVGRGVLASRQGAGVFVTALEADQDWDMLLQRADILDVLEGRVAIETEAAVLAARRRSPHDLRAIRRALAGRTGHRNRAEHVDADMRFHRSVAEAAQNTVLVEMFDSFVPRLREAMITMLRLRTDLDDAADHQAHAALVEAIAARESESAGRLARTHLMSLARGLRPGG